MTKLKTIGKEPEPKVPADLRRAFKAAPLVEVVWKGLTPIARRDFVYWVESAKLAETRAGRIQRIGSMLRAGKRRPCCFTIIPTNLYKALGANPKAKAKWHTLSPTARRDFVKWVEQAGKSKNQACVLLASGKNIP